MNFATFGWPIAKSITTVTYTLGDTLRVKVLDLGGRVQCRGRVIGCVGDTCTRIPQSPDHVAISTSEPFRRPALAAQAYQAPAAAVVLRPWSIHVRLPVCQITCHNSYARWEAQGVSNNMKGSNAACGPVWPMCASCNDGVRDCKCAHYTKEPYPVWYYLDRPYILDCINCKEETARCS